jgi:hypothetical protein
MCNLGLRGDKMGLGGESGPYWVYAYIRTLLRTIAYWLYPSVNLRTCVRREIRTHKQ